MPDAIFLLLGAVFGVLAGWYLASRHSHRLVRLVEDQKRQAARAVRSARDQLAAELEQKHHEVSDLQAKLDEERRGVQSTLSKLRADLARLAGREEKLEKASAALEAKVGGLKSELRTNTEDAFRELAEFHDVASSLERVLEVLTRLIETVESRLLASNVRLRELGISTGVSASARDAEHQEAAGLRNETSVR